MPKKKALPSSKETENPNKLNSLKKQFIYKIVGIIFVLIALGIIFFPGHSLIQKPSEKNPIVISSKLLDSQNTENSPVRILIPKVDIDLYVTNSRIIDGYWELSENTASYGLGSGHPGTKSNTVIFAHARHGLFYNLKDVKLNDTVYVFTKDKWYMYKVSTITTVYPNQTDIIQPTKDETLTLYTCTGFADEKRLIVIAKPVK